MSNIPVTFDFDGKEYNGFFDKVSGAGGSGMYHLSVNGFYWGALSYISGHPGFNGGLHSVTAGWRFTSNTV